MFAAFRDAHGGIEEAIAAAREAGIPVVYANDDFGTWSGDRERVLEEARRRCPKPALIDAIALETCVAQSAIDGRELGYQITLLPDACAAVDPENADVALRYLEHVVGVRLGLGAEAR